MNSLVLKYILTIAEEKNMTRAAERLYISQPSLSQSVKNLEKELGVDLFERSQRGGVLTPAGEHYVEWAKQILFAEAMMKRKIQDISAKNVRQIKFGTTPQRTSHPWHRGTRMPWMCPIGVWQSARRKLCPARPQSLKWIGNCFIPSIMRCCPAFAEAMAMHWLPSKTGWPLGGKSWHRTIERIPA